eukprot:EG_transcript_19761
MLPAPQLLSPQPFPSMVGSGGWAPVADTYAAGIFSPSYPLGYSPAYALPQPLTSSVLPPTVFSPEVPFSTPGFGLPAASAPGPFGPPPGDSQLWHGFAPPAEAGVSQLSAAPQPGSARWQTDEPSQAPTWPPPVPTQPSPPAPAPPAPEPLAGPGCNHTRDGAFCQNEAIPGYSYCYNHCCPGCMGDKARDAETCPACVAFGRNGMTKPVDTVCARVSANGRCTQAAALPSIFCHAHGCPVCGREKASNTAACPAHVGVPVTPQNCVNHEWADAGLGAMMKKCQVCQKTIMDMHHVKCKRCGAGGHKKCLGLS